MASQTPTGPGMAASDPTTGASDPTTAGQRVGTADQPVTGPAGQQQTSGSHFPIPVPGLPANVDPKRMLWWGGLAALAAVGVIEWPVAAVVGAGSYVAERLAREDARREMQPQS
jgi:hypothetical protein